MCLCSSHPPPSLSAWKLYSATSGSFSILFCYLTHWCDNSGREIKETFFPCDKQKDSFCCSWRRTETCFLKTRSWTGDNVLFWCSVSFSFFAQVTFWFCSLHVTNGDVVKGLSPLPTLLGRWLYSGISLKMHISEILTARCQMYHNCITSFLRCG